jgi:hypothetical protein
MNTVQERVLDPMLEIKLTSQLIPNMELKHVLRTVNILLDLHFRRKCQY